MPTKNRRTDDLRNLPPAAQPTDASPTSRVRADRVACSIGRRGLSTPFLLFLAGHRPLAFAAGQLLHTVEPIAQILEIPVCGELAALLSEPQGIDNLEEALVKYESQRIGTA